MKYRLPATMAIAALAATAGLATQPHPAAAAAPGDAVCLAYGTRTLPTSQPFTTVVVGYCARWTMYRPQPPILDPPDDPGEPPPGPGGFTEPACSEIEVTPGEMLEALRAERNATSDALSAAIKDFSDAQYVQLGLKAQTETKAAELTTARIEAQRLADQYYEANGSETSGTTRNGNEIPLPSQVDKDAPFGTELRAAIAKRDSLTRAYSPLWDALQRQNASVDAKFKEAARLGEEEEALQRQIHDIYAGRMCHPLR